MNRSLRNIEWRLTLAVVGTASIGGMGANSMPIWLGAVIDGLAIDNQLGGLLGSIELIAGALGSLWVVPRTGSMSMRRLAVWGAAAAGMGYVLSGVSGGYLPLALTRFAVGAFCGLVSAAGSAAIASVPEPDRVFAIVALIAGFLASGVIIALSAVTDSFGYTGSFLFLGALCLIALPLLRGLPDQPLPADPSGTASARVTPRVAATLSAIFILSISSQGVWAFSERIGNEIGLSPDEIGMIIAVSTLAGLLGSVIAAVLATRFGRSFPIGVGILASGLSQYGVVQSDSYTSYFAMQIGVGLSFFFLVPYLLGLAASLDRQGRWTAAAGAASMLGAALGPGLSGTALEWGGSAWFGALVIACTALAATLLAAFGRRSAGRPPKSPTLRRPWTSSSWKN
jgi:predicted MFS family arabinose efflux permease